MRPSLTERHTMRSTPDWLGLVAREYEAKSKAALARLLSVSRSSVSQQQNGIYSISIQTAVKIADLLGVYPMLVIASTMHDQSRTTDEREFWEAVYARWNAIENRCPQRQQCEKRKRAITYQPPEHWKAPK